VCVRYAGDEFIVVLAGCGWDEAEYKRLELQEAVESLVFEAKSGVRVPLSISAGAAVFPHDGDSYEVLMAKADRRMYRNKVIHKRDVRSRTTSEPPAAPDTRAVS
jgi:diguanylate cyclase (GGDEF)-like protein